MCGTDDFMDVSYNEDKTIICFHGETEHGGVVTKVAMYDADNRPAPMHRATHGMLMELDAMNNIVHQAEVTIRWEDKDYPKMDEQSGRKPLS